MSHSQTSCCVPGCSGGQDVRLHHFPNPVTDIERFRTWVMRVGGDIVGLENMFIFKNKRICTRHFEAVHQYARKLSKTAIPTLNLGSHFCRLQTQAELPKVPVLQQDVAIPGTSQQKLYDTHVCKLDLSAQVTVEPVSLEIQSAVHTIPIRKNNNHVTHIHLTKEEMDLQKAIWK